MAEFDIKEPKERTRNLWFEFIEGMFKWVRHTKLDDWGKWKSVVYPNSESLEKIREWQAQGLKNKVSKDDDGWFTTFSRPASKLMKGKIVGFEAPKIFDGTQKLADGSYKMITEPIVGNGSTGIMKLELYNYTPPGSVNKAVAARWLSTRIDNLVPFDGLKDYDKEEARAVKGLTEQPQNLF